MSSSRFDKLELARRPCGAIRFLAVGPGGLRGRFLRRDDGHATQDESERDDGDRADALPGERDAEQHGDDRLTYA